MTRVLQFAEGWHYSTVSLYACVMGLLCIPGHLWDSLPQPNKIYIYWLSQSNRQQNIRHIHRKKACHMLLLLWGRRLASHSHINLSVLLDCSRAYWKPEERLGQSMSLSFSAASNGDCQRRMPVFCAQGAFHFFCDDSKKQLSLPPKNCCGVFYEVTRVISHRTC